jgi:tetratricopeptide (TPR) repeat protein
LIALRQRGRADILVLSKLASLSLEANRPAESLGFVNEASIQPEAENFAGQLRWTQSHARLSGFTSAAEQVSQARRLASEGRFGEARNLLDSLVESNPKDGLCRFARGEFRQRLGETAGAYTDFQRAGELGNPQARAKIRILAYARALESHGPAVEAERGADCDADPLDPRSYVEYAAMLQSDETPGKALDVLERAAARFGDAPRLLVPLGDLYLSFGMPEEAGSVYRCVLRVDPRNIDARIGLERVASRLREPDFP